MASNEPKSSIFTKNYKNGISSSLCHSRIINIVSLTHGRGTLKLLRFLSSPRFKEGPIEINIS